MNERGLRDALRTLLFNQSRAGRGHQRRRRSCQPCPFGTRRTISRSTCRARARSFLRQRPASSSLRPPSQNPPRSSPLALAWELDHRAHPSLEDFLGRRTQRCIGPREPVETKSHRGRGCWFVGSRCRTSNGSRCARPNRSHPSTRLVAEHQWRSASGITMSIRDLTSAALNTRI